MLTGQAWWQYDPGEGEPTSVPLGSGQMLLSRPGFRERYVWDPDRACAHAYVSFYLDDVSALGEPDDWPLVRNLTEPLTGLSRYLLWLSGTDSAAASARIPEVLGFLVDLFVNGPMPDEQDAVLSEHLLRLVDRLRAAWRGGVAQPLTLPELATAARVSPGHLARVFRQQFGTGPVAAVELIRLARAAIMLQRSNLAVGTISASCGFVNPFHFSRRFRTVYGVPPRTYRTSRPQDPLDPVRRAGLLPLARQLLTLEPFAPAGPETPPAVPTVP
jgi:AraC-like DNA-binding protein